MIPNTGERKNGVRAAQQAGQDVELMGQAQHDERKTRILKFVSHLRIRECDSEIAWMEFGPNITGTWPIKFGFIAEAIDKHKALGGTKIEVLSVQGPVYIFSANINVGTFTNSMMQGDLYNITRFTTHPPSCTSSDIHYAWEDIINKPMLKNVESGKSNFEMFGVDEDNTRGAAGGNTHIRLSSNRSDKINVGFGGLLSLDSLNYVYASKTRRSGPFMFFMPYDSSDGKVDFYLMHASREGTWSSGLKHFNTSCDSSKAPTIMSLSLERCPKRCPSHVDGKFYFDTRGLTSYSFYSCDHHGYADGKIEIATPQWRVWQANFLVVWNAGAILLPYWSLEQKATLAEWVEFTFSGTLTYIFNNFHDGRVYSEVVAEAKEAGYTEPCTKDDLSGTDVAIEAVDIVLVQSSLEEVLRWLHNWDPGGQRHMTTAAPRSGFKQWDPGKVCLRKYSLLHLEDKVNFEGASIDANIRFKGNRVCERGKWRPNKWGTIAPKHI